MRADPGQGGLTVRSNVQAGRDSCLDVCLGVCRSQRKSCLRTGCAGSSGCKLAGVNHSAPRNEAGNREQGLAPREQGCNKVSRISLGSRTHPHPSGEWVRELWEPKTPRREKMKSSEGWGPGTAQHHKLQGGSSQDNF